MIGTMPSKPNKAQKPKTPKRRGTAIMIRIDEATEAELDAFMAAQRIQPERTTVVMAALHEFLVREGFRKPDGK